jgi:hypothetical protein
VGGKKENETANGATEKETIGDADKNLPAVIAGGKEEKKPEFKGKTVDLEENSLGVWEANEEKDEELVRLKLEVERTRREYLEMDYKKRKMWHRVSRFFGDRILRKGREKTEFKKGESGEEIVDDQDVVYLRAIYENSVLNLQKALLEKEKKKGLSNEGLEKIAEYIQKETTVNLSDVHDQIKLEHHEGKRTGLIGTYLKNTSEWYKKQPLKYKLAVGAGLGLAGGVAGFVGASTVLSYVAAASFGRRFAMGAITGTNLALLLEKKSQIKRESKVGKEGERIRKDIEALGMNEAEKLAYVEAQLKEKIFGVNEKIGGIKNKNLRILTYSALVGSFISSGAASFIWQELGIGKYVAKAGKSIGEFFKFGPNVHISADGMHEAAKQSYATGAASSAKEIVPGAKGVTQFEKNIPDSSPVKNAGELPKSNQEKYFETLKKAYDTKHPLPGGLKTAPDLQHGAETGLPKELPKTGAELYVGKGGSLEGTVRKHLEVQGVDKKEAGKMAHRMALQFAKEHNLEKGPFSLIHENAQINLVLTEQK